MKGNYKHGGRGTRLYTTWKGMKRRCNSKNDEKYYCYGGRGIKVCKEWLNDFSVFRYWAMNNGYSDDLTIDRINVNGNYEPSNCRWADMETQMNNMTTNRILTYKGEDYTMTQLARKFSLNPGTLWSRLNKNWPLEMALITPIMRIRRKVDVT